MLSRWVVTSYKSLVEIALWVFLVTGGLIGAGMGSMVNHAFLGFVVGGVAAFFGMAVFLGAALVLGELLTSVQDIRSSLERTGRQAICGSTRIEE